MIEIIRKELAYLIANILSNSNCKPSPEKTIICKSEQVKYYANTPNTIIYYDVDGEKGFFRECRKHLEPRNYVWKLIEEYCRYVFNDENSKEFERILKEKLSSDKNFRKFFNMGAGTASYSRVNKFRRSKDSQVIGIERPYPVWFENQLFSLVQFAWGALDEYKYCMRVTKGSYQTYNSNRTITTKRIVDLLGNPELVPESTYVKLIVDGEEHIGVSLAVAAGQTPEDYRIVGIYPEFQRQSLILNVADVICYQKDHRPGNYYVVVKDGYAISLCAFDNDCPTTLLALPTIAFYTYSGCSPIVNKRGYINRPYLDIESTRKLIGLTKKDLYSAINNSTSLVERMMVWERIKLLKKAIKKSVTGKKLILLDKDEWTENTINYEISGQFGLTYAKLLIDSYINK